VPELQAGSGGAVTKHHGVFVPPKQINSEESTLAKAGVDGEVTLGQHDMNQPGQPVGKQGVRDLLARPKSGKERYVILGRK